MLKEPTIIKGGTFSDMRGTLKFVNEFNFDGVKRFYLIKHPDASVVRAWQGHQFEKKYFFPISGSFVIAWVKIDNFRNPSVNLTSNYHVLSESISEIIYLPEGYANGIKALAPNSEIMVFSSMDLNESMNEKIRYPENWWFDWEKFQTK